MRKSKKKHTYYIVKDGDEDTEQNLSSCPFCDYTRQKIIREHGIVTPPLFYIRCLNCGAQGSWSNTEENAAKSWIQSSRQEIFLRFIKTFKKTGE